MNIIWDDLIFYFLSFTLLVIGTWFLYKFNKRNREAFEDYYETLDEVQQ